MAEHKRPDNIPGYEHPTNLKYSRDGIYKTFTEGKKAKKKEKFGKLLLQEIKPILERKTWLLWRKGNCSLILERLMKKTTTL